MFSLWKSRTKTDGGAINEILSRFTTEVIDRGNLLKKLQGGTELRIKLGIDPTSPHIHLGRAVLLLKLRDFQKLGHKVVLIIGNATGVIGDTSDKESERPMLTRKEVEENAKDYLKQAGKVLDMKRVEVRRNAEWLDRLTYREIGEQADQFSVSDFIARDNIRHRLDGGKRVSLRETLYPLMQGYDSVAVQADVEIGGTDQRFNLLAGRTLQTYYGQAPQDVLMTGLILGTDGRKMSSSWGNTINISDEASDMYGKVMRISDEMMKSYFEACTRVSSVEVAEVLSGNLRDAKMRLAREIVALYHGKGESEKAERQFIKTFQKGEVPDMVEEMPVAKGATLIDALVAGGVVESKSEARRLLSEGAIVNADTKDKIENPMALAESAVYKIGKRRFVRIKVS